MHGAHRMWWCAMYDYVPATTLLQTSVNCRSKCRMFPVSEVETTLIWVSEVSFTQTHASATQLVQQVSYCATRGCLQLYAHVPLICLAVSISCHCCVNTWCIVQVVRVQHDMLHLMHTTTANPTLPYTEIRTCWNRTQLIIFSKRWKSMFRCSIIPLMIRWSTSTKVMIDQMWSCHCKPPPGNNIILLGYHAFWIITLPLLNNNRK